jgi:hypothetical protein
MQRSNSANIANIGACRTQAGWDVSEFSWPTPTAPSHLASNVTATFAPTLALGKRHREVEVPQGDVVGTHTHEVPPQKRVRAVGTTMGILKAARSAARTHHELAARIPTKISNTPKAAGRGAERLATPSAQGICHQPLQGPSFQRGWVVEAADGKLTWVEESVDEEAAHHIGKAEQKRKDEATSKLFEIPPNFEPGHRSLLQASESDFARGAVQEIKCRLCPDEKFKNFQDYKRHCDFKETHPLVIDFCDQCGDFFARTDSLLRHGRQRPPECLKVTPEVAAQKRSATEEAHGEFIRRLEDGLKMGQDIGKPFSEIIKDKYPESSKKRMRTRSGNKRS